VTKIDALLQRFQDLNAWRRRGERAPHKPLLILLALGHLKPSDQRLMPFDQIEEKLSKLLEEFGPPRKSPHPELPFYHLTNDGVWEIEDREPLRIRRGSKNPLRRN
jgi:putative restriction endonuclease